MASANANTKMTTGRLTYLRAEAARIREQQIAAAVMAFRAKETK